MWPRNTGAHGYDFNVRTATATDTGEVTSSLICQREDFYINHRRANRSRETMHAQCSDSLRVLKKATKTITWYIVCVISFLCKSKQHQRPAVRVGSCCTRAHTTPRIESRTPCCRISPYQERSGRRGNRQFVSSTFSSQVPGGLVTPLDNSEQSRPQWASTTG